MSARLGLVVALSIAPSKDTGIIGVRCASDSLGYSGDEALGRIYGTRGTDGMTGFEGRSGVDMSPKLMALLNPRR